MHDLRMLLRLADGRTPHPSAAILDSRTLQSTPTSGARAGYDSAKQFYEHYGFQESPQHLMTLMLRLNTVKA